MPGRSLSELAIRAGRQSTTLFMSNSAVSPGLLHPLSERNPSITTSGYFLVRRLHSYERRDNFMKADLYGASNRSARRLTSETLIRVGRPLSQNSREHQKWNVSLILVDSHQLGIGMTLWEPSSQQPPQDLVQALKDIRACSCPRST